MRAVAAAVVLLAASVCLMAAAILHNRLEPSYATAFNLPIANGVGLVLAIASFAIAMAAARRDAEASLPRRAMVSALIWAVVLLLLLPLSNAGHLSVVR